MKKVVILTQKFKAELNSCIKPNEEIVEFLKSKRNFKTVTALQNLAVEILGKKSSFKKRKDVEIDLAIRLAQKKIGLDRLVPYIKPSKPKKKPSTAKKSRKPRAKKSPAIPDQVDRWMLMKLSDVEAELNDSTKYPNVKSLKGAGKSILKAEDKRKRKKYLIVKLIIDRLAEEQSLLKLGA